MQDCQEGDRLIKGLLRSLLILLIFIPAAAAFPIAAVRLSRTPGGAEFLFWCGPWSCCICVLIYSTLSAVPWRDGGQAVRQHREARGGLLVASAWATCWMFGALFASYGAELILIFFTRRFTLMPIATYSPLAYCWLWRKVHG